MVRYIAEEEDADMPDAPHAAADHNALPAVVPAWYSSPAAAREHAEALFSPQRPPSAQQLTSPQQRQQQQQRGRRLSVDSEATESEEGDGAQQRGQHEDEDSEATEDDDAGELQQLQQQQQHGRAHHPTQHAAAYLAHHTLQHQPAPPAAAAALPPPPPPAAGRPPRGSWRPRGGSGGGTDDDDADDNDDDDDDDDAEGAAAAAGGLDDEVRLTARQRARIDKEAGRARDVAWSEMDLLPKLAYTWRGRGPQASAGKQLSEEEWAKRQETLERRRLQALEGKREEEEAVKARLRRAVTTRFRGRLGGSDAGGGGSAGGAAGGARVQPGWVKLRHTADGMSVAWHPAAHPLSLPMAVRAEPVSAPIDLRLQPLLEAGGPAAGGWRVPPTSRGTFRLGCVLTLRVATAEQQQQQAVLQCVDEHGWAAGCLQQQEVLDALELAGCLPLQQQLQQQDDRGGGGLQQPADVDWQAWHAVVRSVAYDHSSSSSSSWGPGSEQEKQQQQLRSVVVRLVQPQQGAAQTVSVVGV